MKAKKGFTLVEMLISLTVFTVIVTVGANIYVTAARGQKRANLEAAIYNEARAIVDKLAREIRHKTIDYDEYYNQKIIAADYGLITAKNTYYGGNFGEYARNFYDPGYRYSSPTQFALGENAGYFKRQDLGAQCNNKAGTEVGKPYPALKAPPCPSGSVILKKSLDLNVGLNGWDGKIANVFCDDNSTNKKCSGLDTPARKNLHLNQELYLINAQASEKTVLALESGLESGRLAILKLLGSDTDADQVNDLWTCHPDFDCSTFNVTDPTDKDKPGNGYRVDLTDGDDNKVFVPLTPSTVKITDLSFFVSPLEDPRRAFAESTDATQIQPQVIIEMTLEPAAELALNYPDKLPQIRIRTSVSSRVTSPITSYNP